MEIKKTITKNAQLLIAVGTLIGMAIGVINFFILTSVAPLERAVKANGEQIEEFKRTYMPLDLSMEKWKNNEASLLNINKKIDKIDDKLDTILNR